jgi:hypothetical protein
VSTAQIQAGLLVLAWASVATSRASLKKTNSFVDTDVRRRSMVFDLSGLKLAYSLDEVIIDSLVAYVNFSFSLFKCCAASALSHRVSYVL